MKPMPGINWDNTIFVGQINQHEIEALNNVVARMGATIEGPYSLASEAMVFCDPKHRAEVVKAIQNLGKEQMFLA